MTPSNAKVCPDF